ncbi:NAD(P)-dependent oxidoreductase [Rivibacter subsaxonicus]|uniref:D-3-phosphoglycerate dehydrogenase n=1 Tax=Rivibacter subsaxonicus TaxID=457575 RepID=A0A4V2FSS5_9BURK|nr:NAD(P)-dependent oxidoreductase [Rivibacter subsaxonicus]RZT95355.1 D-3-phosphoglycerate dehydrogenase [Rivibacter subsaxonicus]
MDLLIAEPIEAPVLQWLESRHRVQYAPELAHDARALRQSLFNVRAALLPSTVRVDEQLLAFAPVLSVVARVGVGLENLDVEACVRAGVEVVRGAGATAAAEAEFLLGAVLALLRGIDPHLPRPPVPRELAGATVGLIGLAPASRPLSAMLSGFGSRLVGYDPSVHASDQLWGRWRVEPLPLQELLQSADAVCVQLPWYSRYQGLIGERHLGHCKPQQLIVSTSHAALFELEALAQALRSGRVAAAWLDSIDLGLFEPGRPLCGVPNLVTTARLAGRTVEARERAVWTVAQQLDELLSQTTPGPRERRGGGPVSGPMPFEGAAGAAAEPLPVPEARELRASVDEPPTDAPAASGPAPGSR